MSSSEFLTHPVFYIIQRLNGNVKKHKNNSILKKLRLVKDHLIFKFTSISPDVKCSEIIASINIEKVTPEIIATVQELLMDLSYSFSIVKSAINIKRY